MARRGRPTRERAEAAGQLRMIFDDGMDVLSLSAAAVHRSRKQRRSNPPKQLGKVLAFVGHRQRVIAKAQREIHTALETVREDYHLAA